MLYLCLLGVRRFLREVFLGRSLAGSAALFRAVAEAFRQAQARVFEGIVVLELPLFVVKHVFFAGVVIYFGSMMFGVIFDSNVFFLLGESLCCLSFGLGFFLDAAFYKGKSEWESSTGQSNGGSTTGMIFDILFGIIAVVIALFVLIGVATFST